MARRYNMCRLFEKKEGKCMYSLSVPVFPCLCETVCAHTCCMGIYRCIALIYMLSCPDLRLANVDF